MWAEQWERVLVTAWKWEECWIAGRGNCQGIMPTEIYLCDFIWSLLAGCLHILRTLVSLKGTDVSSQSLPIAYDTENVFMKWMYSVVCLFIYLFFFLYSYCALHSNKFSSRNRISLPDFRVLIRSFFRWYVSKVSNYLKIRLNCITDHREIKSWIK